MNVDSLWSVIEDIMGCESRNIHTLYGACLILSGAVILLVDGICMYVDVEGQSVQQYYWLILSCFLTS